MHIFASAYNINQQRFDNYFVTIYRIRKFVQYYQQQK